ncbi:MAG TPA: glycosyltransferase family A protein [Novosphingobium sp.]|nr:glycosyltransferase family A protein [Novosphingobium sp.]
MTRWSVVIPVYNERDFLPATLRALVAQTRPFRLLLVDNASTDGCMDDARRIIAETGIPARILCEDRPGQVHALKRGIDAADTELVAICDADTWYPPHYLAQAEALFDTGGDTCVAAAALLLPDRHDGFHARLARWHKLGAMRFMPRQNHTSGAAQCFRLEALRAAGGYDAAIWPYVLKDHELLHRVLQIGSQACHPALWCVSSDRRASRKGVRWTLAERLAYHIVPFEWKTDFFRNFLGPRFAARGLGDVCLRQRSWESSQCQT